MCVCVYVCVHKEYKSQTTVLSLTTIATAFSRIITIPMYMYRFTHSDVMSHDLLIQFYLIHGFAHASTVTPRTVQDFWMWG